MLPQTISKQTSGAPSDGDMTTGSVRRIYAVCDRRHDVVALLAPNGTPIEHVRYTAYGVAQVRKAADVAGAPGTVNSTDRNALLSASGARHRMDAAYDPELDLNLDGVIDSSDDALLTGAWGPTTRRRGRSRLSAPPLRTRGMCTMRRWSCIWRGTGGTTRGTGGG